MTKRCHWALAAINYKNNDRVTMCPRGQTNLTKDAKEILPSKLFNNARFKQIRKQLEEGIFDDEHCTSCKDWENKNIVSYREKANAEYLHPELYQNMKETGEVLNSNLEYVEFRFTNSCNFSCLHCNSEYSSSWGQILNNTSITEDDKTHNIIQLTEKTKNSNWSIEEVREVTLDLINNFPNLKRVDIGGGEPLYQKQFWEFLRLIVSHPNISNMMINVTSNFGTVVDYVELAELLKPFKKSIIRISIDGGRKIYKYFRTGDWTTLVNNLTTFRKHNNTTILEATCTISAYQVLDIVRTVQDMYELPVNMLHHSFVQYPLYLDPAILDSRFKSYIIHSLDSLDNFFKEQPYNKKTHTGMKIVSNLRKLYKEDNSNKDSLYNDFLYYVERMDKIKNQNFDEVFLFTKEQLKQQKPELKHFCIAPWVHVAQNVGGRLKPCCRYQDTVKDFPKENYKSIETFFTSQDMENFRTRMTNNEYIAGCVKCYQQDSADKYSLRRELNNQYPLEHINLLKPTIKYLEIGLSNACNLACVTCGSNYSTSWYDDDAKFSELGFKRNNKTDKFVITDVDYNNLDLTNLDRLKILGGEPFMEPRNLDLFKHLDNLGVLPNIHLDIVTNATVLPGEQWQNYLSKLKSMRVVISIDGIDEVSEYVRYGTNWNKFQSNTLWWKDFCNTNNFKYQFHYVIHALNCFNISSTITWFNKFHGNNSTINFDCLSEPSYLSVTNLPNILKDEVIKEISNIESISNKDFCLNFVHLKEYTREECIKLIEYVRILNELRNIVLPTTELMYFEKLKEFIK